MSVPKKFSIYTIMPSNIESIFGRLRSRELWFEASLGKKVCRTPISSKDKKLGVVACTCHLTDDK
jgi:hypothetical protein